MKENNIYTTHLNNKAKFEEKKLAKLVVDIVLEATDGGVKLNENQIIGTDEMPNNTLWEGLEMIKSFSTTSTIEILEAVKELIENQKIYTGGSSVNEKDKRINKTDLLSHLQEAIDLITNVKKDYD
jgi:hypothetical protein